MDTPALPPGFSPEDADLASACWPLSWSPEALALAARDGEGLARDLVESLLAVSDYQAFVELMQRVARQCEERTAFNPGDPSARLLIINHL
eukprot:g28803.t1